IAPGVAARKRKELEFGAAGLPVVRTSDILEELGVENLLVRGVVGFIGDTALDPLTFLGPVKGLSLAGSAARVSITGAGRRALNRGIKAAAKGGVRQVRNPRVADVLTATLGKGRGVDRAEETLERLRRFTSRPAADGAARRTPEQLLRERILSRSSAGRVAPGKANIVNRAFDPQGLGKE